MISGTLSGMLARRISARRGRVPAVARQRAQLAIMDCVGVALAGSEEAATRATRRVAAYIGGKPSAALWGSGARAPIADAALVNGVAAHVLDFDDTSAAMRGHPTSPVVPALLALAEDRKSTGAEVVDAYVIGFEIESVLGRLMNPDHYDRGWHATSTLGCVAAAAAAGVLLCLSEERMKHALGIACSSASGIAANFGSMTKSVHVGMAARNGMMAALLAKEGLTSNSASLDGRGGFIELFSGRSGSFDLNSDGEELYWEILHAGILFKKYPACFDAQAAIEAALNLYEQDVRAEAVHHIDCYGSYRCPIVLTYHRPANGLEAKFSLEYAVAIALCDGIAGLEQFSDIRARGEDVQSLLARVTFHVHPDLQTPESLTRNFTIVRVTNKDGSMKESRVDLPLAAENRVDTTEIVQKFKSCAARALSSGQLNRASTILSDLQAYDDLAELYDDLLGAPSAN